MFHFIPSVFVHKFSERCKQCSDRSFSRGKSSIIFGIFEVYLIKSKPADSKVSISCSRDVMASSTVCPPASTSSTYIFSSSIFADKGCECSRMSNFLLISK